MKCQRKVSRRLALAFLGGWAVCGAVGLVGCQSNNGPGSYSHASLSIKGQSDPAIRQVAKEVFAEEGYALALEGLDFLMFERPGTRSEALKWGGLLGQGVVVRGKLKMSSLVDGSCLLQLDMFAVRSAGDRFFEDESRMTMMNKGPYRRLLKEISKRLKARTSN